MPPFFSIKSCQKDNTFHHFGNIFTCYVLPARKVLAPVLFVLIWNTLSSLLGCAELAVAVTIIRAKNGLAWRDRRQLVACSAAAFKRPGVHAFGLPGPSGPDPGTDLCGYDCRHVPYPAVVSGVKLAIWGGEIELPPVLLAGGRS